MEIFIVWTGVAPPQAYRKLEDAQTDVIREWDQMGDTFPFGREFKEEHCPEHGKFWLLQTEDADIRIWPKQLN